MRSTSPKNCNTKRNKTAEENETRTGTRVTKMRLRETGEGKEGKEKDKFKGEIKYKFGKGIPFLGTANTAAPRGNNQCRRSHGVCAHVKNTKHWQPHRCLNTGNYHTHRQQWVALLLWLLNPYPRKGDPNFPKTDNKPVCVCVCVCARTYVCVCVRVCVCERA